MHYELAELGEREKKNNEIEIFLNVLKEAFFFSFFK